MKPTLLGVMLLFSLGACSYEDSFEYDYDKLFPADSVEETKGVEVIETTTKSDQLSSDINKSTTISVPLSEVIETNTEPDQSSKMYRFDYEFNENAGGWLKLHEVPATWQEARLRCHSEGAVLASPLTHQIMEATLEFAWEKKYYNTSTTSTASPSLWLFTGVHSTLSKGDYTSIEGVPLSLLTVDWAEGEPDNLDNSESCLVIDAANMGVMADKRCDDVYPYVCYKKDKKLTIQNECGTTDPEYKLASTGSCYKIHRTKRIWESAFQTCVGEGGHLAIANSEEEARVLSNLIGNSCTLIGFHDWGSSGREWMTIHGETLAEAGYANWLQGEPNNLTYPKIGDMGEFCGSMNNRGQLNDVPCHYPAPFICELSPGSILQLDYPVEAATKRPAFVFYHGLR